MKIIIAAGGTGGHVFPAISTAQELLRSHQVIFFTTDGLAAEIIKKSKFQPWIVCQKKRSSDNIIIFVIKMIQAARECFYILRKILPDVVVGFGGYPSFPVVFAAWILKIPVVIHEQNVVAGRANRLAAMFASKIAISFDEASRYFDSKKVVLTGCPSRFTSNQTRTREDFESFDFKIGCPTVLVFGGSQASQRINKAFSEAAVFFKGNFNFQFIHICGKDDYSKLWKKYSENKLNFKLFDFFDDIGSAYRVADLVIARSGASTISELIAFKKYSILVPYPSEKVHQKENALVLSNLGVSTVIEDSNLSSNRLYNQILSFFKDKENKINLDKNLFPESDIQASQRLAQEVERTAF